MARLHDIDAAGYSLGALQWQDHLWQAHSARTYGFGFGISAMPSMHNAICCIYVLATRRATFLLRIGARVFAGAILIGSVHLGWHYLVDGLFAWAAAAVVWWMAGVYLRLIGYRPADSLEPSDPSDPDISVTGPPHLVPA